MTRFAVGEIVFLRWFRHSDRSQLSHGRPGRVLSDDDHGLMLWTPGGSLTRRMIATVGEAYPRTLAAQENVQWRMDTAPWRPPGLLTLIPPASEHSVWWFFHEDGEFDCWYVNLEERHVRWSADGHNGVDTGDNALDIVARPAPSGNTWVWKDEDEFDERIGHPWYWNVTEAAGIRAEGERVAAQIEAGEFPFDGSFRDFRPDPAWTPITDTSGYALPRVPAGVDG